MPQVVDARTPAMFVEGMPLAKADPLAHQREVVSGCGVGRAFAAIQEKERCRTRTEDPIPLSTVGAQPLGRAFRYGDDAALAILAVLDGQRGLVEIDILVVEPKRFAHS
jgi:hypothetical protein